MSAAYIIYDANNEEVVTVDVADYVIGRSKAEFSLLYQENPTARAVAELIVQSVAQQRGVNSNQTPSTD